MEYVLKTKDLKKTYGNYNALNGLSMNVPKGSIYGLIGRNGVGKTTLIRLICGLQKATEGDFSLYGINNHSKEIVRSRKRIGAVVETPSIYLDMSAEDNLKQQYRILGIPSYSTIPDLLKLFLYTGNPRELSMSGNCVGLGLDWNLWKKASTDEFYRQGNGRSYKW